MSKKSLNLAAAVFKNHKGKESRDIKLTEKEIAKFIDGQIEAKEKEIKELEVTKQETSEENYGDFVEMLLTGLDGREISNRTDRQNAAQYYCVSAISQMSINKTYQEQVQESIDEIKDEIKQFKQLRIELENIDVEVEGGEE